MSEFKLQGSPDNLYAQQVTILNGASVSEVVATQGKALVGMLMPASWTSANIGFKTCMDGNPANLKLIYGNANAPELCDPGTADRHIAFPSVDALYVPFLAIASVDGSGVAVNQAGDRVIVLLFREFLK